MHSSGTLQSATSGELHTGRQRTILHHYLLGDYGCLISHEIRWGIEHEDTAVKCFEAAKSLEVHPCGVYISHLQPFFAASPDELIHLPDGSLGLIEIKCLFNHHTSTMQFHVKILCFALTMTALKSCVSEKNS